MNQKTKETIGDCPICLKPMYKHYVTKTNCEHSFHDHCLEQWLQSKNTCPMCREALI